MKHGINTNLRMMQKLSNLKNIDRPKEKKKKKENKKNLMIITLVKIKEKLREKQIFCSVYFP